MNSEVNKINFKRSPETVCYDCIYRLNTIYKKEGTDAALGFLVDLISKNAFAANVAYRRFRRQLNRSQQESFIKAIYDYFDDYLSNYRIMHVHSAIATATALSLKDFQMTGRIMQHFNLTAKTLTIRKLYEKRCHDYLFSSYLSDESAAAYFYYRYLYFGNGSSEIELYSYDKQIRFRDEIPELLAELIHMALNKGHYRYLCSLLKVFPDVTINNTGLKPEELNYNSAGDNSRLCYIVFAYKLTRDRNDPAGIDRWYQSVRSQFDTEGQEETLRLIELYYLCRSITCKNSDIEQAVRRYRYRPVSAVTLRNVYVMDAIEDAFEYLLKEKLEYVDAFIERLGNNNVFMFDTDTEYKASSAMTYSRCRMIIEKMHKAGYTAEHILRIFMNSRLRSCYPFSLLIRNLYFNNDSVSHGDTNELAELSEYVFSGRVVYSEENKRFRLISYNFRNHMMEIYIGKTDISFRKLKMLEQNSETVRFRLYRAEYRTDKPGNVELMAMIVYDGKENNIQLSRQYISIKDDSILNMELSEKGRSVERMRYLYREFAAQRISYEQLKQYLMRENQYVSKSFAYQINAQNEVFRSFRKLENSYKRFLQAVNTLQYTSPSFSTETFLNAETWENLRNYERTAFHKEELIDLYKSILARQEIRESRRISLYGKSIMKYLLPYNIACQLMAQQNLPYLRNRFLFTGKLISHKTISNGRKMLLTVNHTIDPSETIKVVAFKGISKVEFHKLVDGRYYIMGTAVYEPENDDIVVRFLKKIIPVDKKSSDEQN